MQTVLSRTVFFTSVWLLTAVALLANGVWMVIVLFGRLYYHHNFILPPFSYIIHHLPHIEVYDTQSWTINPWVNPDITAWHIYGLWVIILAFCIGLYWILIRRIFPEKALDAPLGRISLCLFAIYLMIGSIISLIRIDGM